MVIGSCPYDGCDGIVWQGVGDVPLPKFVKHDCEDCGRTIWTKLSRIDPESWTEEDFPFDVDEETKQLTPKSAPKGGA